MEVRDAYKNEFLAILKESPAWELFVVTLLQEMHFIQDEVKFIMGGTPRIQALISQYIGGETELVAGTPYEAYLDVTDTVLKVTDCLVSNDGVIWGETALVTSKFYIKSVGGKANLEGIYITVEDFYPDAISGNDLNTLLAPMGLFKEEVLYSSFDMILSATSPYLIHYILKREKVPFVMEYLFQLAEETAQLGARVEVVNEGIYIQRVYGTQFRYESEMTLVAGRDFIVDGETKYEIKSINKNTLTCDYPEASGIFTVERTEFVTPILNELPLSSVLEFQFTNITSDQAERFISRVTPVRCAEGFKGLVNVIVRGDIKITDLVLKTNQAHYTLIRFLDEISMLINQDLSVYAARVKEGEFRLTDLILSDYSTEEIILI